MGTEPSFAAIRFFRIPEGRVGDFTGDARRAGLEALWRTTGSTTPEADE